MDPSALGPAQTQEKWVRTQDPLHLGLDDGPMTCGFQQWTWQTTKSKGT